MEDPDHCRNSTWILASAAARSCAALLLGSAVFLSSCTSPGDQAGGDSERRATDSAETAPPSADTLYYLGRVLAGQGKDDEAITVFTNTISRHPEYLAAYVDLAEIYVRQRRFADAEALLVQGLEVDARSGVLWNNLGMVRMFRQNDEGAKEAFAKAVAAAPREERYAANLALATGLLGQYDEAFVLFEQILGPEGAHHNLAVIAESRGDTERAAAERTAAAALAAKKPAPR